jgi:hypothetical protein
MVVRSFQLFTSPHNLTSWALRQTATNEPHRAWVGSPAWCLSRAPPMVFFCRLPSPNHYQLLSCCIQSPSFDWFPVQNSNSCNADTSSHRSSSCIFFQPQPLPARSLAVAGSTWRSHPAGALAYHWRDRLGPALPATELAPQDCSILRRIDRKVGRSWNSAPTLILCNLSDREDSLFTVRLQDAQSISLIYVGLSMQQYVSVRSWCGMAQYIENTSELHSSQILQENKSGGLPMPSEMAWTWLYFILEGFPLHCYWEVTNSISIWRNAKLKRLFKVTTYIYSTNEIITYRFHLFVAFLIYA